MKQATVKLIEEFPYLEKVIQEVINQPFSDVLLKDQKDDMDKTFIQLAYFFEHPTSQVFSLSLLYQHLENDWLEFALYLIHFYFANDTFLIQKPHHSLLIDPNEKYYNQTEFARYLQDKGLNYTQNKIAVYCERGKFPKPDQVMSGKKYWSQSTVEAFADEKLKE